MPAATSLAQEALSFTSRDDPAPRAERWPGPPVGSVHGTITPADVRTGDPVRAQVRVAGRAPCPWQVWRISPLGVELVRPADVAGVGPGTPLEVTLHLGGCTIPFPWLRVASTGSERGRELVALAWADARPPGRRGDVPPGEDRGATRWACDPDYLPTGIAPEAARYGDFVYFRVLDVSSTGMRLETSLRNTFLVPGLRLPATCTFPTLGPVQLALDVVHARVVQRGEKAVLSVGVRHAARRDGRAREVLGQYLLRFGAGATVQALCAEGFRISASSRALEFGHVRTEQEYAEVLRLRRTAYVHARKLGESTKDVDMADGFDARSRILVAKHRGRVVGTMRMSFPATPTDRLAHESWVELPASLPPRDQLVELFKACTHPGYRGSDLFYALSRHAALTLVQSGRRWALVSATDGMAPVYE